MPHGGSRVTRGGRRYILWLAAAASTFTTSLASAYPANWLNAASGNWWQASNWSSYPDWPNNGTDGLTFDVCVVPTGANYTIAMDGNITIDSLKVTSANATLHQGIFDSTLRAINGIDLEAGTYYLSGAIHDTTIRGTNGHLLVNDGILDNVTLNLPLELGIFSVLGPTDTAVIKNRLTLNHAATTTGPDIVIHEGGLNFTDNSTFAGNGEVRFDGPSDTSARVSGIGSMNIGPGITIRSGTSGGFVGGAGVWTNQGTILSETPGHLMTLNGTLFNISGLVEVSNGALLSLNLDQAYPNPGIIRAVDSTIDIGGNFSTGTMGNFFRSGGTLNITGRFINSSNFEELRLNNTTGSWTLKNGTIAGGTVFTSDGARLLLAPNASGTLDGVKLDSSVVIDINNNYSSLYLTGAWHNHGAINLSNGKVYLGGEFTPGDVGTINRSGGGEVWMNGTLHNEGNTLVLDSTTGTWIMDYGTIVSGGHVAINNGGKLRGDHGTLSGVTFDTDFELGYGTSLIVRNGLTLNNANLPVTGITRVDFLGDQTLGGTGEIIFNAFGHIASGGENFGLPGALTIGPNITIRTGSEGGRLGADNAPIATLKNQGAILSQTPGKNIEIWSLAENTGSIVASNGGSISFRLAQGDLGNVSLQGASRITIVDGTYNLTHPLNVGAGATLEVGGTWSNDTSIVVDGGTFNMGGSTAKFGAISLANAQLNVKGNYTTAQIESIVDASTKVDIAANALVDNTGDTIDFDNEIGTWRMAGGRVRGGTVKSGSPLILKGYLDQVALETDLVIPTSTFAGLGNVVAVNPRTISVIGTLGLGGTPEFLGGTVQIVFDGGVFPPPQLWHDSGTLGPGTTVRTGISGGVIGTTSSNTLLNKGLISAQTPGATLTVASTLTNQGTLQAINGGILKIQNLSGNLGAINLADGTLDLAGFYTLNAPITLSAGSTLALRGACLSVWSISPEFTK